MASSPNATTFPTDESNVDIWDDRTNLEGLLIQGIAYGIHLIVFCGAIRALFFGRHSTRVSSTKTWLLASYTFYMFAMGTFMVGANTQVCVSMFVDNRGFIAGPSEWIASNFGLTANTFGDVAYMLGTFGADALLLYRVYTVWNKNIFVVIGPFLMFLTLVAFGVLVLYETVQPMASLWTKTSANFVLIFYSLDIPLNIVLTGLIVFRLWRMSRYVKEALGASHARTYTSIAAMMAESAAPYTIFGIVFLATFAANSPGQNLFLPMLGQVMCLSPELIIWRVATGHAWSEQTTGVTMDQRPPRQFEDTEDVKLSNINFAKEASRTRIDTEITDEYSQPSLLKGDSHV